MGYAANYAITKSKGKFLARFDADDLMPKIRLEKQIKFLLKNPKIIAVGGQCIMIDENNKILGKKIFPLTNEKIRKMAFIFMSLQVGSIMINKNNLPKDFQYYSTLHHYYEDHDLLFKLLRLGQVANLPQTMLYYRQHNGNSSKKVNYKSIFFSLLKLRIEAVLNGLVPNLNGILVNIAQLILISLLPNKLIEKLYFFLRITLNKSFILNRVKKGKISNYKYRFLPGY